jgi:SAM-dependent methyltransferase
MGITYSSAALLAKAKQNNVCFDKILTIGHQYLNVSQKQVKQLAKSYSPMTDSSVFFHERYADKFLETFLDAKSVMSMDYSDYENCDIVHDMNYPVDPSYHEKFDAVIDGGSLEHIFNLPVAITNYMKLVKKGGSLFIFTTANNHTGHGFYQFSPELFFRIFQPENGFEIRDIILEKHSFPGLELSHKTKCFSVVDPSIVKSRVGLVSNSPVMIMVHAIKTETKSIFTDYPIQSDYLSAYSSSVNEPSVQSNHIYASFFYLFKQLLKKLLPLQYKNFIDGKRQLLLFSFSNNQFYKRWYPYRQKNK